MLIPCQSEYHWRRVRLYFQFPNQDFDISRFYEGLGTSERETNWVLGETGTDCHSHAQMTSIPATKVDHAAEPSKEELWTAILVDTFRTPLAEHGHAPVVTTHSRLLEAIILAVPSKSALHPTATIDLYYNADSAKWKVGFMADPPEFGELGSDIGRISLAGVTFRFSDSEASLFDVVLDVSPSGKEFRCRVFFGMHIEIASIEQIYVDAIKQAENFASYFVQTRNDRARPG